MNEATRRQLLAASLRAESDALSRRYWAARASRELTPAECEDLERARLACLDQAEQIETVTTDERK